MMTVFSINGCGLRFLGIQRRPDGNFTATVWATFLFLPLFPIKRLLLANVMRTGSTVSYVTLQEIEMKGKEVIESYLFGLLLFPLLLSFPLILTLGLISMSYEFTQSKFALLGFVFGIAWFIWATWKLKNWDENRWDQPTPQK